MAMNLPSQRSRGRRAPMADINVTPLVDVMLVLLIIFMVTAPLLTAGVPVNLPDSRAKALDQDQEPVADLDRPDGQAVRRRRGNRRRGAARAARADRRAPRAGPSRRRCSCAPTARSITAG